MIPLLAILGAITNRVRGMTRNWFPRPMPQMLLALPFAYVAHTDNWWITGMVFILTLLSFLTGYGGAHDLGTWKKDREDETLEFFVIPLRYKIPEYWYDNLFLSLLGVFNVLPCVLATMNPFILLVGLGRPLGYMIGWYLYWVMELEWKIVSVRVEKHLSYSKMYEDQEYRGIKRFPRHLDVATEIGEFLTGAFLIGGIAVFI